MNGVNPIPEKVVNYNVYSEDEKLIGISGEVTLPNLEAMTETISGAGIAGEYESPLPGHFGSVTVEIPFRVLLDKQFNMFKPGSRTLVLRASQQHYDMAGGQIQHRPLKVTLKGLGKGIELGKLAVGAQTETKTVMEVLYIKIVENNVTILEYDKLNFIFIVNGVDVLETVRSQI